MFALLSFKKAESVSYILERFPTQRARMVLMIWKNCPIACWPVHIPRQFISIWRDCIIGQLPTAAIARIPKIPVCHNRQWQLMTATLLRIKSQWCQMRARGGGGGHVCFCPGPAVLGPCLLCASQVWLLPFSTAMELTPWLDSVFWAV